MHDPRFPSTSGGQVERNRGSCMRIAGFCHRKHADLGTQVIGRKNWLFSDTARGAEASAAIYSIAVTAKLNGLNQRAYLEWILTEMPNDGGLGGPGRIDRYLP